MKIRVPVLVQDQMVAQGKGSELTELVPIESPFFLDGPVSARVAIIDFDDAGGLRPMARFVPPGGGSEGSYAGTEDSFPADAPLQVSVFGTIHATLEMFEEPDTLGRQVSWAFDGPQLLVVPRAGDWENAYYERDSRSLQFFSFPSFREGYVGRTVYTCLSRDIVAHETAHAILDGIAPDLYNALSPQSLALHEAIADVTAFLMSIRSRALRQTVLDQTDGSLMGETAFTAIAEEFGVELARIGPLRPLRSLVNDKKLPDDGGLRASPHGLSEILSGALYAVLVKMHEAEKQKIVEGSGQTPHSASGRALFIAGEKLKRMALRALDYLPPGEISFADFGRAIVASDVASHPRSPRERDWLAEELASRNVAATPEVILDVGLSAEKQQELDDVLAGVDLRTLVDSDWVAYEFANRNREILGAPQDAPLYVRPRLDVCKTYWLGPGETRDVRECIFKVSWDVIEENPRARGLPPKRQITMGVMLAIDWETKRARALLSSDSSRQQRVDRDASLMTMHGQGRLRVGAEAIGPDGEQLRAVPIAEVSGDILRIRKSARMLHIDALEA